MRDFIIQHGGLIGSIILVLTIYNVVMMGIQKIFDALGKKEPGWLQRAGSVGSAAVAWLTKDTQPKPPQP